MAGADAGSGATQQRPAAAAAAAAAEAAGEAAAEAHADARTTREELRALCLAAAVGIRDECLLLLGCCTDDDHDGGEEKAQLDANDNTASAASGLAGCGSPLVQLLARQAACIVARYEPLLASRPHTSDRCAGVVVSTGDGGVRSSSNGSGGSGSVGEPQKSMADGCACEEDGKAADQLVLKRLDDLLSIAYKRFYAYLYKDLPLCWRQLYTDAAILKFCYLLLLPSVNDNHDGWLRSRDSGAGGVNHVATLHDDLSTNMDEMVKMLDLALILAGAGGEARGRAWIDEAFELLDRAHVFGMQTAAATSNAIDAKSQPPPAKRLKLNAHSSSWDDQPSFPTHEPFTPPIRHPIRRAPANTMDMPAFQHYLDASPRAHGAQPLIITNLVESWPARTEHPWNKPAYLLSRTLAGRRLVPVEVGRSYVDAGWGQKLIRFADFLAEYIDPSSSVATTAYLAQHQLLLQLPQLRSDIRIPDLCYTAPPGHPTAPTQDQPELAEPMLNAWLGPPGTITPLHTDPYHNLLVQVVGRKYVRLYAPQRTAAMCARGKEGGVEMGNTSMLDVGVVEGWDARPEEGEGCDEDGGQDEDFKKVPFVDCILEPGDTLYIPIGWWHYVRGLSVSFSVSIWWN